jgi:hypothetical protein
MCLHATRSEGIDLLASHVEVVWPADGLEIAGDDEIEHHASIDAQEGSGVRPADERCGGSHVESLFAGRPSRAADTRAMKGQRPIW